jgi:hypothetical protein
MSDANSNSKIRGAPLAKPQAVCGTIWTVDALKTGKNSAVVKWNSSEEQ